jgi:hypothetical protein
LAVIKTSSWFTKLPADHCRIGISRGTPSAQKAPYRNYRQLTPGPWFKTCATPQEYVRLYYTEVLSKLDPMSVVAALAAMADGGIPTLLCWEAPPPNEAWCHRALVSASQVTSIWGGLYNYALGAQHASQREGDGQRH